MHNLDIGKRQLIVIIFGLVFALSTVILHVTQKKVPLDSFELRFPAKIAEYESKEIVLDDEIFVLLETDNIIMREYSKPGEPPILFYLIFDPEATKASDPPENCLRGDDRVITSKTVESLSERSEADFKVNRLIVEKNADKHLYVYWFIAGDKFTHSYFRQRLELMGASLRRNPLSGGQVRISTMVLRGNEAEALERLELFIQESLPFLDQLS